MNLWTEKPGNPGFFCFQWLQHVLKQREKKLFFNMQTRLLSEFWML
jgi:hypothetical protein